MVIMVRREVMFINSTVVAHKAMEIDNIDEETWPELLVVLHEIV